MGLRISIGAIIAVLLGGGGYFAQQSQSTKSLLQQREAELLKEKESSTKLKSDILRFKNLDQKMKGLESQLADVSTSAKTRMEELSKLVAEKNAAILQEKAKLLSLATALEENQATLDNERKERAEATSRLIAEKNAATKQEKAKIRNLETTLDILNSTLNNERKIRTEEASRLIAEKNAATKQEKAKIRNLETTLDILNSTLNNERKIRTEEANRLIAEKSAGIKQEKAKIRNLETTLDILNSTLNNERKIRTEEANRLIAEKSAGIKQEKAKIRNLAATLDILNGSLENERKARAEAEKANTQNSELAANQAEEIKRLETQAKETSRLIEERNAGLEQEKTKARKFEIALKQLQANLKSDRKTQALVDKLSRQSIEFAAVRAREIKRLERVRGILEAQVLRMDKLIASEQKEAKKNDITAKTKPAATTAKVKALNGELARKRAEEIARLDKTRTLLKTQVQEMSQLITEKNAGIAREKTKAQNLELALNQIRTSLDNERQTRVKSEKANARNAELARIRAEEIGRLTKARELQKAQIQEMSQLIGEKTSVAELIKNKLDQTNLSLAETIKKHTLAIARSKVLEKRASEEAERAKRLEADLNELDAKLKKQTVNLEQTRDQLRVTFVNSLLFDSGSATLKGKGIEALSTVADFLQKQKDKMIRIEGHTDNKPIKGNLLDRYPSNWELSFARSIAIVKFLESKNISPARMSATGHSFYRPVASNDTDEGRARNRRTVILLDSPRPTVERAVR